MKRRQRAPRAWARDVMPALRPVALLAAGCSQVLGINPVPAPADDAGASADEGTGDAALGKDAADSGGPVQLAKLQFLVNGAVLPMTCATEPFSYMGALGGAPAGFRNVGAVPIAYIARTQWNLGAHYTPGVSTGPSGELTGVLAPGQSVDISGVYTNGIIAIIGSSAPFTNPDAGAKEDEGVIAWPNGVAGSEGATEMQVAEITGEAYRCGTAVTTNW